MTQPTATAPAATGDAIPSSTSGNGAPHTVSNKLYDVTPLQDNGSNYQTWKYRVLKVLTLRKLNGIVNGNDVDP
ncbi:hypothetical protein CERSUDRAFT_95789, partial [Gelatoporia subvermispora B]